MIAASAFVMKGRGALNVLIAVVAMNAIYVGAALDQSLQILLTETLVASLVCGAAVYFFRRRSALLALPVLVHGLIDGAHMFTHGSYIPDWYIWACLGFDFPFAAGAWFLLRREFDHSDPIGRSA